MKPLFSLVFGIVVSLNLVSCNQQVKQERLERIDSLQAQLAQVETTLMSIDSTLLQNRVDDITATKNWIFDNITDTLSRSPGMALGDFIRTEKNLKKTIQLHAEVRNEYTYSEQQINNLRKDITEQFYSEEEFKGYFKTESASIKALVNVSEDLRTNYESSIARYNKFKPLVVNVTDSIKQVIYNATPIAR